MIPESTGPTLPQLKRKAPAFEGKMREILFTLVMKSEGQAVSTDCTALRKDKKKSSSHFKNDTKHITFYLTNSSFTTTHIHTTVHQFTPNDGMYTGKKSSHVIF